MKYFYLLLFFVGSVGQPSFAQDVIDSTDLALIQTLQSISEDKDCKRCDELDSLYKEGISRPGITSNDSLRSILVYARLFGFRQSGEFENLIEFYKTTHFYGMKLQELPTSIRPQIPFIVGSAYFYMSQYDTASSFYVKAANSYKELGNYDLYSHSMNNLAICLNYSGKRIEEIEVLQELHSFQESRKDTFAIIPTKVNLALTLYDSKIINRAEQLLQESLTLSTALQDSLRMAYSITNLANIYADRGQPDTALSLYRKAIQYAGDIEPALENQALNGIASTFMDRMQYDSAYYYYEKAYLTESPFVNPYNLVYTAINFAATHYEVNKNLPYADSLTEAYLPQAKQFEILEMVSIAHATLGKSAMRKGKLGEAENHFMLALNYKDSARTFENDQLIADLEIKYQLEKKQNEVDYLKEINEKNEQSIERTNLINTLAIGGTVILLVLFVLILYDQKRLNKVNKLLSRQEKTLTIANENLVLLNKNRERMIATIAHDLRGPLGGVSQLLRMAKEEESKEEAIALIDMSYSASKSTYGLLENLLEWAREKQGLLHFKPKYIYLKEPVDQVCGIYDYIARQKSITLKNNVDNEEQIYADVYMLETILRNLINNALKFTDKNGLVEINSKTGKNSVIIEVKDNGVGMSQEKVNEIFNQEDMDVSLGTNQERGTGFGLLLCQTLVKNHKGKIWIESKVNEGTRFYVELPNEA